MIFKLYLKVYIREINNKLILSKENYFFIFLTYLCFLSKEINELNIKLMESHKEADELYKGAVVQSLRELDLKQSISELQVNQAISPQQPQWILNNQQVSIIISI